MSIDVKKSVTNSAKWGRVTRMHALIGDVQYSAERFTGDDHYTVSSSLGRCGMAGRYNIGKVSGGRGHADRFAALVEQLHAEYAFVKPEVAYRDENEPGMRSHAEMCCDREVCEEYTADNIGDAGMVHVLRRALANSRATFYSMRDDRDNHYERANSEWKTHDTYVKDTAYRVARADLETIAGRSLTGDEVAAFTAKADNGMIDAAIGLVLDEAIDTFGSFDVETVTA